MLDSTRIFASSADRMSGLMTQLPNTELIQQTIAELNGTLKESVPLLAAMRGVMSDMNQTLDRREPDARSLPDSRGGRRSAGTNVRCRAVHLRAPRARLERPRAQLLLVNTRALVGSDDLGNRLDQMQSIAANGMGRVGTQGDHWIDRVFWRALFLVVAFFAALVLYRATSVWMVRRFPPRPGR